MRKRNLNKQQQNRISAQQQRLLTTTDDPTQVETCNGRVLSRFGKQIQVEATGIQGRGEIRLCHQRANLPDLITGDLVRWEDAGNGDGVIVARAERRNEFRRPDAGGREKALAANLDCIVVVIAAVPQPFMNLIDRYLVALENLMLTPLLVLNKTDLLSDADRDSIDKMMSIYEALGYSVHRVCAHSGAGVARLERELEHQTSMLVGQSGVGKSSLLNRLGQAELSETGALSSSRGKGRHTTTAARLFHLRYFDVIDSPGIREFKVGHLDSEQLVYGYRELRGLPAHCRFRSCSHRDEPGCALQAAAATSAIEPLRWQSFLHLRQESARQGG